MEVVLATGDACALILIDGLDEGGSKKSWKGFTLFTFSG
jgi:hypothetical protein